MLPLALQRMSLLLALLAVSALAGCLGGGDGDANADALPVVASREFRLDAGEYAEANLDLAEGDRVEVTFETDAGVVEWNIHTHGADGGVETLDEGSGTSGVVPLTAAAEGPHSFMWQVPESGATLTLNVTVRADAPVASWHPY